MKNDIIINTTSRTSSEMLKILELWLSQLLKKDNFYIKNKGSAPNLSVIWKLYCICGLTI